MQDALTGLGLDVRARARARLRPRAADHDRGDRGPVPAGGRGDAQAALRPPRAELGLRFAHTLIPIAAAYVVAHYFSLLAYQGQDVLRLSSDPLGTGADLLKTAGRRVDYSVVSATTIWYVQVLALVAGHVAALVLGHDRALAIYGGARAATRSQVVMLILMVCFTCLGLYLLSVANA